MSKTVSNFLLVKTFKSVNTVLSLLETLACFHDHLRNFWILMLETFTNGFNTLTNGVKLSTKFLANVTKFPSETRG